MSPTEEPSQSPHYVKSAEKTLAVLLAFTADNPHLTVTEVAAATHLTRAAARRFLLTLTDLGYLSTEGSRFALTPRVLDFGAGFLAGLDLPKIAQPHLNDLALDLDESATLSILDADDIVYIARAAAPRLHAVTVNLGNRLPAWATSMGRMLIAELPETFQQQFLDRVEISPFTDHTVSSAAELGKELKKIRVQGWCLVSQELDDGLRGLAVPVRRGDNTLAALNVSLHTSHLRGLSIENDLVPRLQKVAASIAEDYGGRAE
ncbi:IclR family transcriptional regulator C-terminal domain-containing protein [Brevibacterium sp. ZH18]|uniref:IclR family transcriptional regulator domain-containing protein n=1 Tax=Brevibacterium sp. ZH18 TaxID=2927784 RepID=UPI001F622C55|nr:IclR family transcriptional regulator C-terminal domain-containing protein [Brevibacterium sp. ZH18]MCI4010320.1 helix-turn-helix domain-containing protein [Brevibacterium sp. ZH18]